jgi:hypothetical protein
VAQLTTDVRAFLTAVEAANENKELFATFPTQYYDKTTDLFNF